MKRTSRKPSTLSESVQRHLNAYALAASAAGVGMLALSQPAEAKIVYTPAHQLIYRGRTSYKLDLNHDRITDFTLVWGSFFGAGSLKAIPAAGNSNWATSVFGVWVSAVPHGFKVDSHRPWANASMMGYYGPSFDNGPWASQGNLTNRYLGLRFIIGGKVHYGWARLSIQLGGHSGITALLTGYAYETIPNRPIFTGKTRSTDVITLESGSLGALAAGASRLHRQN
jgi:hypothetical protein